MPLGLSIDPKQLVGREPERLTYAERMALAGMWIAVELYDPKTLPLRRIEAVGSTVEDCIRELSTRGKDPTRYEYTLMKALP